MRAALKLSGLGGVVLVAVLALVPWKLKDAGRRAEIVAEIERQTGLVAHVNGPITLKLLPRPRLRLAEVSVVAPDGTVTADAPVIYGDLDIPSILTGRMWLVSATLADPTVTVDVDAAAVPPSLFDADPAEGASLPFRLALRAAVLRLKSARPGVDTLLTDVNATAHRGAGAEGGLALSGAALWRGASGQFTLRLARPGAVMKGGISPLHLQLTSTLGTLSASGDLTGGPQAQFAGRLSASTQGLPRLFAAFNMDPTLSGVARAAVSGEALARLGDMSLSESALRLDDMSFEGTLGLHADNGRTFVEGTLATGLIDLNRLSGRRLDGSTLAALYRTPFGADLASVNLDLRVSAGTARVGDVEVRDAAFSALFHDGRLEVTVDEAHAYDGTLKARAVATLQPWGAEAHGDLALTAVDVGALATAWTGRETMSGLVSGKLVVDGRGGSLSDLLHSLSGDGQVTVEHGRFIGLSVSQALRRLTRKLPAPAEFNGQTTAFASASTGIGIVDGVMHFLDGKVVGPGIRMEFGGRSDLPRGRIDITAVAVPTDAGGSLVPDGPRLPFEMSGTWGAPFTLVQRSRALTLPPLPVPALDETLGLP